MTRALVMEASGKLWGSERAMLDLLDALPMLEVLSNAQSPVPGDRALGSPLSSNLVRNALTFQRHRIRNFLCNSETPLLLDLGSGPRGISDSHWVNVDGYRDTNVHYLADFRGPLPFRSESFNASSVFCFSLPRNTGTSLPQTNGSRRPSSR